MNIASVDVKDRDKKRCYIDSKQMQLLLTIGLACMMQWVNFDQVFEGVTRFGDVFHACHCSLGTKQKSYLTNRFCIRSILLIQFYFLHMYTCLWCQKKRKVTTISMSNIKKDRLMSNLIEITIYVDNTPTDSGCDITKGTTTCRQTIRIYYHRHFSSLIK